MRSIILAAGRGSRLRPITDKLPKSLVPLQGRSLLSYQLDVLRSAGIPDINIVTGYLPECFDIAGVSYLHNPRYMETNMVYSLFVAESLFDPTTDLVISYGDIIYSPAVLKTLLKSNAPISIAADRCWERYWHARMSNPLSDAETLKLNYDRVTEIGSRPTAYSDIQAQYIGLIKIKALYLPAILEFWNSLKTPKTYGQPSRDQMCMTSFLQHLVVHGWDIRASLIENGWAEIDTLSDLKVAAHFSGIPFS